MTRAHVAVSFADWHSHSRQEKERGAEQRTGRHEEGRCQEGLICHLINVCYTTNIQTDGVFFAFVDWSAVKGSISRMCVDLRPVMNFSLTVVC